MSKLYIGTSTLKKFQLPIFFKILLYYSIISGNKDASYTHFSKIPQGYIPIILES